MKLLQRNLKILQHIFCRHSSALYMTGDKAKETFAVLSPFMDFSRLQNVEAIQTNLANRKFDLNMAELLEQWHLYSDIENRKRTLEEKRCEIAETIKLLPKDSNEIEQKRLRNEGKILRDDLKNLKEHSYSLEDVFVHNFLRLPNELHESTPTNGEKRVIFSTGESSVGTTTSHTEASDLIEWTNPPIRYYLKGEAAKFDALLPLFAADCLKKSGFIQFSNPDFVRSILVEASAIAKDSIYQLWEEDSVNKLNLLHLSGGGSMMSFLTYISKLSLYPTALPLKLVANGKQYLSKEPTMGLFDASQVTTTQLFVATANAEQSDEQLSILIDEYIKFFQLFKGQHFQVVSISANHLLPAESHRIAVEMFSPSLQRYIEVGSISGFSDFISKRLLFNYREGKAYKFPHLLSGTVVNVERLLALLIEQSEMEFKCPDFLKFD